MLQENISDIENLKPGSRLWLPGFTVEKSSKLDYEIRFADSDQWGNKELLMNRASSITRSLRDPFRGLESAEE